MKIMMRIKTVGSLILIGVLVPFLVPLQMIRSLVMTERVVCPWEGRDMLKPNIKLKISFYFQTIRLIQ